MLPTYNYKKLTSPTEIRVFSLKSGDADKPLECTIQNIDLNDSPNYIAISYVWGDRTRKSFINVDESTSIELTNSLKSMFNDLRQCEGILAQPIWVDQISINQNDIEEKNHQVSYMSQIYRKAKKVIIYTGPKEDKDDAILDLAEKSLQEFGGSAKVAITKQKEAREILTRVLDIESGGWDTLLPYLTKPWQDRRWIVQESVVNDHTELAFGSRLMSIDALGHILSLCWLVTLPWESLMQSDIPWEVTQKQTQRWVNYAELMETRRNYRSEETLSLADVLTSCDGWETTDPRDRVYSVLGIASDTDTIGLVVDYDQSASQVLLDTATRIITHSQSLWILSHITPPTLDLPSWVSSWDLEPRTHHWSTGWGEVYSASGKEIPFIDFEGDGKILVLKGLIVDEISVDMGTLNFNPDIWQPGTESFTSNALVYCSILSGADQLMEGSDDIMALHRMLTEDRRTGTIPEGVDQEVWNRRNFVARIAAWLPGFMALDTDDEFLQNNRLFQACLAEYEATNISENDYELAMIDLHRECLHTTGKHMCITSGKRFCTSKFPVQKGDKVAVLYGGRVCYILRPTGTPDEYTLISDAWLDKHMQGEAINASEKYGHPIAIKIR